MDSTIYQLTYRSGFVYNIQYLNIDNEFKQEICVFDKDNSLSELINFLLEKQHTIKAIGNISLDKDLCIYKEVPFNLTI